MENQWVHQIEEKFSDLSKSQQRVAKLVLDDPQYISLHSATEVGKRAETSETTVIRFCYAIGMSGYTELQNAIMSSLVASRPLSSLGTYMASKEPYIEKDHLAADMMWEFGQQISELGQSVNKELFAKASEELHKAKQIILIGEGASYIAAQWFGFTLSMLRPQVRVATKDTTTLIQLYQQVEPETVVVLISLHRYYQESLEVTQHLKSLGAKVVAITDSKVAPATRFADYFFTLTGQQQSTIDLIPGILAFLNTLAAGMMKQDMPYYKQQREQYEQMHLQYLQKRWS